MGKLVVSLFPLLWFGVVMFQVFCFLSLGAGMFGGCFNSTHAAWCFDMFCLISSRS